MESLTTLVCPAAANPHDAARVFYLLSAGLSLATWGAFTLIGGSDFHRRGLKAAVITQPTRFRWAVPVLHRHPTCYRAVCHSAPLALLVAAAFPGSSAARFAAAISLSSYALAEASITNSHRDYANVYSAWALALLPDTLSEAMALGVCVLFIGGSGYSKLAIGGWEWLHPSTLKGVLQSYSALDLGSGGPGSPRLNRLLVRNDGILRLLTTTTIFFECVLVPASLLLPPELRCGATTASVGLHVGIALTQSAGIGLAFLPNVATYVLGFGASTVLLSRPWWYAVFIGVLGPAAYLAGYKRTVLPEDWPVSPFALFPWSATQWHSLFDRFVTRDSRLVLYSTLPQGVHLEGLSVRSKHGDSNEWGQSTPREPGAPAHGEQCTLHDGWELAIGETIVHCTVIEAVDWTHEWSPADFVHAVAAWLKSERRLVEIKTGLPLKHCAYVRVGDRGIVKEVLAISS